MKNLRGMTIREIIDKYYNTLHNYCSSDKVISLSLTEEDILHNVCITAMRKFKDNDIEESEGLSYLKLTLYNEQLMQTRRICKDKLVFVENICDYEKLPWG